MKAPICKGCGGSHWSTQPCPARPVRVSQTKPAPTMANKAASNSMANTANGVANASERKPHATSTYRYRNQDSRRAYQREYMRRWRAARRVLNATSAAPAP